MKEKLFCDKKINTFYVLVLVINDNWSFFFMEVKSNKTYKL